GVASGLATAPNGCTAPLGITTEGKDQPVTGGALDNAGSSTSDTALVSIDRTKPQGTASRTPAANGNGWNNSDVAVSFACSDPAPAGHAAGSVSGVASCPSPIVVSSQ